jgi:hypothetical protein
MNVLMVHNCFIYLLYTGTTMIKGYYNYDLICRNDAEEICTTTYVSVDHLFESLGVGDVFR